MPDSLNSDHIAVDRIDSPIIADAQLIEIFEVPSKFFRDDTGEIIFEPCRFRYDSLRDDTIDLLEIMKGITRPFKRRHTFSVRQN